MGSENLYFKPWCHCLRLFHF